MRIISAIKHIVTYNWFFFTTHIFIFVISEFVSFRGQISLDYEQIHFCALRINQFVTVPGSRQAAAACVMLYLCPVCDTHLPTAVAVTH